MRFAVISTERPHPTLCFVQSDEFTLEFIGPESPVDSGYIEGCLDVCGRIRRSNKSVYVWALQKCEERDTLMLFRHGVDDVFYSDSSKIIELKLKTLPRLLSPRGTDVLERAGVRLSSISRRVWAGPEEVNLTRSQFDILHTLMRQPGRVFDRLELIENVIGDADRCSCWSDTQKIRRAWGGSADYAWRRI